MHHESTVRRPKPLADRAGLGRTFGSLIAFAAALFLTCGIYILADAFAHPLDAQAAGLIFAACVIALAALLLFFLLKPRKRTEPANRQSPSDWVSPVTTASVLCAPSAAVPGDELRRDLAYQRIYVDHTRVQR